VKPEGRTKTQALTVRLSDRTRFTLEALMRATGLSMTGVLERAVEDLAHQTHTPAATGDPETSWSDYWHVDDGIRTIRILAHPGQRYRTREEEELLDFLRRHWEFFAANPELRQLRPEPVGVLWPHIAEHVAHWRRTKASQPYAAGIEMQGRLAAAGIDPPKWPR
jgi:hypothetical protein